MQTESGPVQPDSIDPSVEPPSDISRNEAAPAEPAPSTSTIPPTTEAVVNGISHEEAPADTSVPKDDDTEMGGTS